MLKKELRLNPIFKSDENYFIRKAIRDSNFKLFKILHIYKFDFTLTVVDENEKTLFDYFAVCPSNQKEVKSLNSKRIPKIILKDPKIFKSYLDKGISGIKYLIKEPYLLFRMTLKKFNDPSAVWMKRYIFSYNFCSSKILNLKCLLEKSTELKKNIKFKILETLVKNVFLY